MPRDPDDASLVPETKDLRHSDLAVLLAMIRYWRETHEGIDRPRLYEYIKDLWNRGELLFWGKTNSPGESTVYDSVVSLAKKGLIRTWEGKEWKGAKCFRPEDSIIERYSKLLGAEIDLYEHVLTGRFEPLARIVQISSTQSVTFVGAIRNIVEILCEALYVGSNRIVFKALDILERYASGSPFSVFAFDLLARLQNNADAWKKAVKERLKYAENLALDKIFAYFAAYQFYSIGDIKIHRLNEKVQGETHLRLALDLFIKYTKTGMQSFYDDPLIYAIFLSSRLSDPQRDSLLELALQDLRRLRERVERVPTPNDVINLFLLDRFLRLMTDSERQEHKSLILDLLELVAKNCERYSVDLDEPYRAANGLKTIAEAWSIIDPIGAKFYFRKSAFFAECAAEPFISRNELTIARNWLQSAIDSYEQAGEKQSWKSVALKLIELEHQMASAALSNDMPRMFLRSMEECRRFCEVLCWEEHTKLCEVGISKIMRSAEDQRDKGNYHGAINLFVVAAKLSKLISDDREGQCMAYIEDCLQTLQFSPSAYLLLTYNEELNKYLRSFYESVGDHQQSVEYTKKAIISKLASRVFHQERNEIIDKFRWIVSEDHTLQKEVDGLLTEEKNEI